MMTIQVLTRTQRHKSDNEIKPYQVIELDIDGNKEYYDVDKLIDLSEYQKND